MPLELFEDEFGDPRNAAYLDLASDLAYLAGGPGSVRSRISSASTPG